MHGAINFLKFAQCHCSNTIIFLSLAVLLIVITELIVHVFIVPEDSCQHEARLCPGLHQQRGHTGQTRTVSV